ncbi:uncharacterized protein [Ptychodera flava]|uniref:uncharacterized protein n=1 Tax=Ptychodera flava TaxID=63121 RepID=UPI00396A6040
MQETKSYQDQLFEARAEETCNRQAKEINQLNGQLKLAEHEIKSLKDQLLEAHRGGIKQCQSLDKDKRTYRDKSRSSSLKHKSGDGRAAEQRLKSEINGNEISISEKITEKSKRGRSGCKNEDTSDVTSVVKKGIHGLGDVKRLIIFFSCGKMNTDDDEIASAATILNRTKPSDGASLNVGRVSRNGTVDSNKTKTTNDKACQKNQLQQQQTEESCVTKKMPPELLEVVKRGYQSRSKRPSQRSNDVLETDL